MGNIHLVTGYAGKQHITSADQAVLNAATFGGGQYVLSRGNQLAAAVVTNNQINVLDGDILMQGRHIRLNEKTSVDLVIENGTQGYRRNDLIVARYTKDESTGVEDAELTVIRGTPTTSDPVDPAYTKGDLLNDNARLNDMPLYRVQLDGLNISALVPLFVVVEGYYDENGNATTSAVKLATPRTVQIDLGSSSAASFDGTKNVTPGVSGTLPVKHGGTGATTAAAARTNLGITPVNIGAIAENVPITTDCNIELKAGGNKFFVTRYTSTTLNSPCSEGLITDSVGLILTYAYTANYSRQLCMPGSSGALCMRVFSGGTVTKWFKVLDDRGGTVTGQLYLRRDSPTMFLDNPTTQRMSYFQSSSSDSSLILANGVSGNTASNRSQLIIAPETRKNANEFLQYYRRVNNNGELYNILHTGNMASLLSGYGRVETGCYEGTGGFGSKDPNIIEFTGAPKFVVIIRDNGTAFPTEDETLEKFYSTHFVWIDGMERVFDGFNMLIGTTVEGNTFSWSGIAPVRQFNEKGSYYYYFAIVE